MISPPPQPHNEQQQVMDATAELLLQRSRGPARHAVHDLSTTHVAPRACSPGRPACLRLLSAMAVG
jgi:hypothetical protein